jgi:hypothetical protein
VGLCGCGELDGVAELFELGNEVSSASVGLVFAGEVVGAELGVGGFVDEEVPADHQDRVGGHLPVERTVGYDA